MSTFMANKGNIERKWYILDAGWQAPWENRYRGSHSAAGQA